MANVEGKATAITVLTPVKRGGPVLLWLVFWAGRNVTETLKKLEMLSFIHYARWVVIDRFPDGDGRSSIVAAVLQLVTISEVDTGDAVSPPTCLRPSPLYSERCVVGACARRRL